MQVQYYQDPMHTVDPNFEIKIQIILEKMKKIKSYILRWVFWESFISF
jgi:hypothetical protein